MSEQLRKRCYEFGPFRLDVGEGQLWRDGEEIQLTQKSFKVLTLLVENGGHVLDKNELMEKVWPDAFVEENRLADNISTLRKLLGDDPKAPSYIRTVPGRGYRFVADVREVGKTEETVLIAESKQTHIVIEDEIGEEVNTHSERVPGEVIMPAATLRPATTRNTRRLFAAAFIAAAALAALAGAYYVTRMRATGPDPAQLKSLAVLPFRPLNGGPDEDHFGLGMADALITKLGNVRRIVVRPTSAVLKYSDTSQDLPAIAREQQVDALLDGKVQRAGDRVRLTVQLVRSSDGAPLWAETFDEKLTDIFALQDSISRKVVAALGPQLSGDETARLTKRYTENTEAHRLYLQGRYFWNKRTADGFQRAVDYYQQAATADPNYALAHAGLAETYVLLPNWTDAAPEEAYPRAERAARRALQLDPLLAEAYTALANVKLSYHRDWEGAGQDFRRAIELNPNYATAHQWYSEWLGQVGRLDEAVAESETAQSLDPVSPVVNHVFGFILYFARRPDPAAQQMRKSLELDPGMFPSHIFLSRIYFDGGHYDQAINERAVLLARGDESKRARFEAMFNAAYRAGGREALLRKLIEVLDQPGITSDDRLGGRVENCALLGDANCTFKALQEAEQARHPIIDYIKVDPYFDFLRSDPRYAELLGRLKLPAS